jgi:hypothetical protein
MPIELGELVPQKKGFNPHPALLPGDALDGHRASINAQVSIHTRHCCRVMQSSCRQC